MEYTKQDLKDMYDGVLQWEKVKSIMSSPKDDDRFDKYVEILQEQASYSEKIIMPMGNHLNVVAKEGDRIVKCDCGYEFGDYRTNWKLNALIYVRNTDDALDEIYPGYMKPQTKKGWCEVREFYCPGCAAQLEVEAVPPGYPITFDFLPDLDLFYREWLGKPLTDRVEFEDKTFEVTSLWAKE